MRTAVTARVQNNGQSCIAAKRFIVVDEVADEFLERFAGAMDALVVGDPFDPATDVGPIVSQAQRDELLGQVEAARPQGATVHAGAKIPDGDGWWFAPTVLSGVTTDMPVAREEFFGPVAMVIRVPDVDGGDRGGQRHPLRPGLERVEPGRGRDRPLHRGDRGGCRVRQRDGGLAPELPFGGIKRSGYGRELSELGLKEFANAKTVYVA